MKTNKQTNKQKQTELQNDILKTLPLFIQVQKMLFEVPTQQGRFALTTVEDS